MLQGQDDGVVAVTFDFWNTLVVEPPGLLAGLRFDAVRAALNELKASVADEDLRGCLAAAGRLHETAWTAGESFQPRLAADHLADSAGAGLTAEGRERLATAFLEAPAAAELELAPGAASCLRQLRGSNVRLGIVCDVGLMGSGLLRAFLGRKAVLSLFDGWAFSDEVGSFKPSPAIFSAALDELRVDDPSRAIHIGDLRRTDVAGARAVGMGTVRYRGVVDDPGDGPEADHVISDHAELPALVENWPLDA